MPKADEDLLKHIGKNGPCDAYGATKTLGMNLSTVQNAIRRLRQKGLIDMVGEQITEKLQTKYLFGLTLPGLSVCVSLVDRSFMDSVDDLKKYSPDDFHRLTEDHSREIMGIIVKNRNLDFMFDELSEIYLSDPEIPWSVGGGRNILRALRGGLHLIDPRRTPDDLPLDFLLSGQGRLLEEGYPHIVFEVEFFQYIASQWRPFVGDTPEEVESRFAESFAILRRSEEFNDILSVYAGSEADNLKIGLNLLTKYAPPPEEEV